MAGPLASSSLARRASSPASRWLRDRAGARRSCAGERSRPLHVAHRVGRIRARAVEERRTPIRNGALINPSTRIGVAAGSRIRAAASRPKWRYTRRDRRRPTTRTKLYKLIWNALGTEFGPWQEWYAIDYTRQPGADARGSSRDGDSRAGLTTLTATAQLRDALHPKRRGGPAVATRPVSAHRVECDLELPTPQRTAWWTP
jgi:hypothetical protein